MDTLFRLVSLQSSSSSSDQKHHQHSSSPSNNYLLPTSSSSSAPYLELPEQECGFFAHYNHLPYYFSMDNTTTNNTTTTNNNNHDNFSASTSSSKHPTADVLLIPNPLSSSSSHHHDYLQVFFSDPSRRWATDLLLDCAAAVASRDTPRVKHLMWILNELASPYADLVDHKLASYFLQALFARLTSSGPRTLRTLSSASDRSSSFDSTRRTALRFQELSPWSSFGHLAANSSILDSFFLHPRPSLHILDLSTTFCTQWPTLLESLATRSSGADDTPHLSITAIVPSASPAARRVMREISARMDKFGRLMAVPFRFSVIHHPNSDLSSLDLHSLIPIEDSSSSSTTFLAVNCVNSLHGVPPSTRRRDTLLAKIRRLRPDIITVVEEEAELDIPIGDNNNNNNGDEEEDDVFLKVFKEGLRFFSAYFDSLEECFPKTSGERLALERAAGRAVVDLVACPAEESAERRDIAAGWSRRLRNAGFRNLGFSEDVNDDLRALLKRYKEGWGMQAAAPAPEEEADGGGRVAGAGVFLTWKEEPVVWASAWKLA